MQICVYEKLAVARCWYFFMCAYLLKLMTGIQPAVPYCTEEIILKKQVSTNPKSLMCLMR